MFILFLKTCFPELVQACFSLYFSPPKHFYLKTAHPSPLSVTKFFGSKCFSKTNDLLKELGREPINWNVVLP
ncbi:unnamed protein product [Meloidogyne enterolobii]|uniref:Uncharacterized protein n=1 Tax=Meloidogyne enterolobii TaxID=390850 RepID=A0ACB0ZE22_MELEN